MSLARFRADERKFGDKVAGLRVLQSLGLPVAPHRVLATRAFQQARQALWHNAGTTLPAPLAAAVARLYADLVASTGQPLVLVRGSLAIKRPPCGRTLSDMADSPAAAVEVARRIYQDFLAMVPVPAPDEAVALILQSPTFQLADLRGGDVLTGILATHESHLVIEGCAGDELRCAPKWWNGTSAGLVSWSLDLGGGPSPVAGPPSCSKSVAPARGPPAQTPCLSDDELSRIVTIAKTAQRRLGADVCIEWVRAGALYFHQLRPIDHAFHSGGRRAALAAADLPVRWTSAVAVGHCGAFGRLCLPGPVMPAGWPGPERGPMLLVRTTRKGELPVDPAAMHTLFAAIVDPGFGSRLSHVAAQLSVPCIAVPAFDPDSVTWTVRSDGLRLSRDVWTLSMDASGAPDTATG